MSPCSRCGSPQAQCPCVVAELAEAKRRASLRAHKARRKARLVFKNNHGRTCTCLACVARQIGFPTRN